jgi:membrane peptidoglycan carboxypeptidase
VEEQATTIATMADHGQYSTPHVIQQITDGSQVIPARIIHRTVLTPDQAADVDWAMSFDTQSGGTAAGLGLTNGQTVIAKTGTTNLSQSAFFMGATPREAMAVGMFVSHPGCTLPKSEQSYCTSTSAIAFQPPAGLETLFGVGGLSGYGGQYPALIWHDFFMDRFNNQALVPFPPVNGAGAKWNLMGQLPKQKPKPQQDQGGGGNPGCGHGHHRSGQGPCGQDPGPTPTVGPSSSPSPSSSPTTSPTHHPGGFGARDAASGGTGAGVLALAAVVIVGPSLSVVGRLRDRRRRKAGWPRERPPAG